jgi:hypothetical protein
MRAMTGVTIRTGMKWFKRILQHRRTLALNKPLTADVLQRFDDSSVFLALAIRKTDYLTVGAMVLTTSMTVLSFLKGHWTWSMWAVQALVLVANLHMGRREWVKLTDCRTCRDELKRREALREEFRRPMKYAHVFEYHSTDPMVAFWMQDNVFGEIDIRRMVEPGVIGQMVRIAFAEFDEYVLTKLRWK